MCLYPKLIRNRKYIANKKNGGIIPEVKDKRTMYVPVGCTKCMECKKQKARQWSIRLQEHIRTNKNAQFVTLTFSTESLKDIASEIKELEGYERENEIATIATRRFLERWRKKYGTSVTHWLVTELGTKRWEHIHIHGIVFTPNKEDIKKIWGYGNVFIGDYVNERTINYVVKYITKTDIRHKEYQPKILTSAGIGSNYINRIDATLNKFKVNGETKETYTLRTGKKINLPIYYRNKIYTEDQKEQLWLKKLDKKIRYVNGLKIDISKGEEAYYQILKEAQKENARLGYGDDKKNWSRIKYENQRRNIMFQKRIDKHNADIKEIISFAYN